MRSLFASSVALVLLLLSGCGSTQRQAPLDTAAPERFAATLTIHPIGKGAQRTCYAPSSRVTLTGTIKPKDGFQQSPINSVAELYVRGKNGTYTTVYSQVLKVENRGLEFTFDHDLQLPHEAGDYELRFRGPDGDLILREAISVAD